ncbi:hypothetical protein PAERUG_P1_London_28_IMP_1_04_05_01266 [Pseudomonas aeruginosa]|nr:hypothetical protein PAERUG_P1_London_28_IMP_1_04_05_01266 [Pseudomonas aeruginosa]CRP16439.1 hypothetical protein PAERUG_E7_London_9_VIM_2_02_13_02883 [Pseudomonas aeruginosa]CRP52288.1 hypothetical protein PAERUG_P18_London_17_VIM_2_04_10_03677 [Pseudomonas aeruginosa]CRQ89313.1 hypothetical protein PAERUG_E15_London_28_01_14_06687 [Pseudomonas aeruginosa]CRR28008.1 hypothetical protein PAERUG_E16_London_17_VIM_2_04_14_04864 [Pseudomonas aeruginosa]
MQALHADHHGDDDEGDRGQGGDGHADGFAEQEAQAHDDQEAQRHRHRPAEIAQASDPAVGGEHVQLAELGEGVADLGAGWCVGRRARSRGGRRRGVFAELRLACQVLLDDDAAGRTFRSAGLFMAAFRAGHGRQVLRRGFLRDLGVVIGRFHQAQAGRQVDFLVGIGAGLAQGGQVTLRLGLWKFAFQHHRATAEEGVDLARFALEQAGEIVLHGFERCVGHQLAGEDDLEALVGHAGILVSWGERNAADSLIGGLGAHKREMRTPAQAGAP